MKHAMREVSVPSAACVILIMLAATRHHTSGPVPTPKSTYRAEHEIRPERPSG